MKWREGYNAVESENGTKKHRALYRTQIYKEFYNDAFPFTKAVAMTRDNGIVRVIKRLEPPSPGLSHLGIMEDSSELDPFDVGIDGVGDQLLPAASKSLRAKKGPRKSPFLIAKHVILDWSKVHPTISLAQQTAPFLCGQGLIHSRYINLHSSLFLREACASLKRKEVLERQVDSVTKRLRGNGDEGNGGGDGGGVMGVKQSTVRKTLNGVWGGASNDDEDDADAADADDDGDDADAADADDDGDGGEGA